MSEVYEMRCCNCGILFALDDGFYSLRKGDGKMFFCPNGHQQRFVAKENAELELKNVKAELEETKAKLIEAQIEIRRLKCEELAKNL